MLRKFFALLVAMMLVLPAAALAKDAKPGLANGIGGTASALAKTIRSSSATGGIGSTVSALAEVNGQEASVSSSQEFSAGVDVENNNDSHGKSGEKGKLKARHSENERAIVRDKEKVTKGKEKETADKKGSIEESRTPEINKAKSEQGDAAEATATIESSSTAKAKGITIAMHAIMRNIQKKLTKTTSDAVSTLEAVVNKFASWLGLGPVFITIGQSNNASGSIGTTGATGSTTTTGTVGATGTAGSIETSGTVGISGL